MIAARTPRLRVNTLNARLTVGPRGSIPRSWPTSVSPRQSPQLEERLAARYAELPPGRVATAVREAHARFETSKIRDFVPLLVERRASGTPAGVQ